VVGGDYWRGGQSGGGGGDQGRGARPQKFFYLRTVFLGGLPILRRANKNWGQSGGKACMYIKE